MGIKKRREKQHGRKSCQIEKDKGPNLQVYVRKKRSRDGPLNFMQQQPDPEVDNWKNHVKRHILQHKFITDQHL